MKIVSGMNIGSLFQKSKLISIILMNFKLFEIIFIKWNRKILSFSILCIKVFLKKKNNS